MLADKVGRISLAAALLLCAGSASAAIVPDEYPTIQAAIDAVVGGGLPDATTIEIRPGTYAETLTISTTARSMILRALGGPGTVTVNATGKGRSTLIVLDASGSIRFEGLRFTGGRGDATGGTGGGMTLAGASPSFVDCIFDANSSLLNGGGGVLTRSNASFLRCSFTNNAAVQFGGGLVITTGSRPLFANCTFQGNTAGTSSAIGSGGAIHSNDASPTLRGCLVSSNQAKFAGGGIFHMGVFGSPNGTATLLLEDSEVSSNTASRATAGSNPAEGGGIHIEDGALGKIVRSRIRNNTANTGGGLNAYRARYEVDSSIIEGNQAPDPNAVGGFGGGIQASSNNTTLPLRQASELVLTDTVVRNNSARIGGGIFIGGDDVCAGQTCTNTTATKAGIDIDASLVDSNTATQQAGGVYAMRATLYASGSLVSRNRNTTGDGYGGGFMLVRGTNATLAGVRIAANEAAQLGGGIFADVDATLSVSSSSIYRNTAGSNAGGLYVGSVGANSGTVEASALVDNSGATIVEQCPSPATAGRLAYTNNTIVPASGTVVYSGLCNPPGALTVAGLNALAGSSGNSATLSLGTVQSLAHVTVTPHVFPAVLAWSVIRASSIAIVPAVSPAPTGDTGTVDVDGTTSASWSVSATTPLGPVGPLADSANPPPATTVNVTFTTDPAGLELTVDGATALAPVTVASANGITLTAVAPLAQMSGSDLFLFSNWGTALSNTLSVVSPATAATYTARYQASIDIGPLEFQPVAPCRLIDTRLANGPLGGPALAAGTSRTFVAWNTCGIPTTARALSVNLTGTEVAVLGHLRIHPSDQRVPGTSALNLVPGINRANNAIVALDGTGRFSVQCVLASGSTHLVVDVNGYFE